jgi:hypothetical protein
MSDLSRGPGWWLASDGKWYPPNLHPEVMSHPQADGSDEGGQGAKAGPTNPGHAAPPRLPEFPPFAPSGQNPGSGLPGSYGYPSAPPFAGPYGGVPGYGYPLLQRSTNGLAIASLVLSILTLVGIGSILGIIFGFVSRRQIKRSNGIQKGEGLATAGISVGFLTLALVLLAVAIPTFLGVKAANDQSVIHLPPTPIVLGQPVEGGQAPAVPWQPGSQSVDTTLTPVPGGVDMTIATPDQGEWAGVPAPELYRSMQLSANAEIISGPQSNSIGLGCVTPSHADQFDFVVHNSGLWQVELLTTQGSSIVDSGISSAIRSDGSNALTIACGNDPGSAESTQLSFEINGTPVSSDVVNFTSPEWVPAVQLCSCDGADTGRFTSASYYAPSSTPAPSSA